MRRYGTATGREPRYLPRMTLSLRVRPQLAFAACAAGLLTAELAVVASQAFVRHPQIVSAAVAFDLVAMPALLAWLTGALRPWTAAMVGAALAGSLLPGVHLRWLTAPAELVVVALVVRKLARGSGDWIARLRSALPDTLATRVAITEVTLLWYGLCSWRTKPGPGFTAHKRAGLVAIDAVLILSVLAEAIPLNFWLHGGWRLGVAAFHAYSIVWFLGDLQALRLRPITVEDGALHLRIGLRWEARIPLTSIALAGAPGLADQPSSTEPPTAQSEPLRVGVIGTPNLVLRFTEPQTLRKIFGIERRAISIALLVDDPDGLVAALHCGANAQSS